VDGDHGPECAVCGRQSESCYDGEIYGVGGSAGGAFGFTDRGAERIYRPNDSARCGEALRSGLKAGWDEIGAAGRYAHATSSDSEPVLARDAEVLHGSPVNAPTESQIADAPHPLQVKAWQKMGGSGRLALAVELGRKVRAWKRDALRGQNPTWSAERVERELAWIYLRGNT